MKFATKQSNSAHYTSSMLPHYLGKLEVQICCLKKWSFLKLNLNVPILSTNFNVFDVLAEVLRAN